MPSGVRQYTYILENATALGLRIPPHAVLLQVNIQLNKHVRLRCGWVQNCVFMELFNLGWRCGLLSMPHPLCLQRR